MEAAARRKLRKKLDELLDRGWGGCECPCHGGRGGLMHFLPCCTPDRDELEELCELLLQDPEFAGLFAGDGMGLLFSEAMIVAHAVGKKP